MKLMKKLCAIMLTIGLSGVVNMSGICPCLIRRKKTSHKRTVNKKYRTKKTRKYSCTKKHNPHTRCIKGKKARKWVARKVVATQVAKKACKNGFCKL